MIYLEVATDVNTDKPTITDIAREAGVSTATVSRVINRQGTVKQASIDAVLDAIQRLGYSKRESKRPQGNGGPLIAVVLPDIINPFYSRIIDGVSSACRGHNYRFVLSLASEEEANQKRFLDEIRDMAPSGILLLTPITDADVLQQLEKTAPVVQCAEFSEQASLPYVSIDDFAASRSLVEYMLSKGYRKIAIINGPREFKYSRKRLEGYKSALKNAGISVNSNYIYHVSNIHFETALPIISQLLSSATRPDALLCVSDVFAAAAVRAANLQGLSIPKDIAIAGIDDTYLAAMCTPTITCVRQPQYSLGVTACELLLERISNPYAPFRHILLPTELVVRESL